MTIPAATAATLDLLDQLMVADDVWAYSAEEGRAVANHILDSQAAIVLLYGPARAASTAFMQRWVIPLLSQRTRVSYVASGEPISFEDAPDAATSIRIFDGFEHHLAEGATPTDALRRLADAWDDARMDAILLLQPTVSAVGYDGPGDFFADQEGHVRRRRDWEVAPFLFSGIQLVHPRIFEGSPDGAFSMNLLYDRAIAAGRLFALRHDGEWLHVSTPRHLEEVEAYLVRTGLKLTE